MRNFPILLPFVGRGAVYRVYPKSIYALKKFYTALCRAAVDSAFPQSSRYHIIVVNSAFSICLCRARRDRSTEKISSNVNLGNSQRVLREGRRVAVWILLKNVESLKKFFCPRQSLYSNLFLRLILTEEEWVDNFSTSLCCLWRGKKNY